MKKSFSGRSNARCRVLIAVFVATAIAEFTSGCGHSYKDPGYAVPGRTLERAIVIGDEWPLPGMWTCPDGQRGPFPAVVLVGGSGRVDHDATIGVNKPFRDIALGLAAHGVCTLRYDKRKAAHPERAMAQIDTLTIRDDTIDDALLAIAFARRQPETDPRFLFVVGHSLGGYAIPRLSALSQVPCGFVSMAGTVNSLEQIFVPQARRFAAADGEVTEDELAEIAELEVSVRRVRDLRSDTIIDRRLLPGRLPAAYWLDLNAHPAAKYAEAMTRPVLVLQGERDLNVAADEITAWRRHLRGNSLASFITYPTLNHMFVHNPEGTVGNMPPGNVAERVIDDITGWIVKNRGYCERRHSN